MPRRPAYSLTSVLANVHLLTGVPSFSRWPLNVHFFAREARTAWDRWLSSMGKTPREGLEIKEDFEPLNSTSGSGPSADVAELTTIPERKTWGIHALSLDYGSIREYVERAHNAVSSVGEESCMHCNEGLEAGKGLYSVCPNEGCEAVGHLKCWSMRAVGNHSNRSDGGLIPLHCTCPSCGGRIRWGDMMKELTLRTRGSKEVEKLFKKRGDKKAS